MSDIPSIGKIDTESNKPSRGDQHFSKILTATTFLCVGLLVSTWFVPALRDGGDDLRVPLALVALIMLAILVSRDVGRIVWRRIRPAAKVVVRKVLQFATDDEGEQRSRWSSKPR